MKTSIKAVSSVVLVAVLILSVTIVFPSSASEQPASPATGYADAYAQESMQHNIREEIAASSGDVLPAYFTASRQESMERNIREEQEVSSGNQIPAYAEAYQEHSMERNIREEQSSGR